MNLNSKRLQRLLPMPKQNLSSDTILNSRLLYLLPSNVHLAMANGNHRIRFNRSTSNFRLFNGSAPLFLYFQLRPLQANQYFLVKLQFTNIRQVLTQVAFRFLRNNQL